MEKRPFVTIHVADGYDRVTYVTTARHTDPRRALAGAAVKFSRAMPGSLAAWVVGVAAFQAAMRKWPALGFVNDPWGWQAEGYPDLRVGMARGLDPRGSYLAEYGAKHARVEFLGPSIDPPADFDHFRSVQDLDRQVRTWWPTKHVAPRFVKP